MVRNIGMVGAVVLLMASTPALAQSGMGLCMQDINRYTEVYKEKKGNLTPDEQRRFEDLLKVGRSKCEASGQNALNTKSPEFLALDRKLEGAPPSQATIPPAR